MNLQNALVKLYEQREQLNIVIKYIEDLLHTQSNAVKQTAIIHSVSKKKAKKKQPGMKWTDEHRARFMASMAKKREEKQQASSPVTHNVIG